MPEAETVAPTTEKAKAEPAPIIRGRMPALMVFLARHGAQKAESTKHKAEFFGTTVGKVDDIAKNRNFGYIQEGFKPTEQQKADAIAWIKRHPKGAEHYGPIVNAIEDLPVATTAEAEEFEAIRVANRGQTTKTKEGEEVKDAGGGNRRPAPKAKSQTSAAKGKKDKPEAEKPTGDALME